MNWLILAQESSSTLEATVVGRLLQPDVLPFMVGIVAIVVWGFVAVVSGLTRHRERMTMIHQGINPDAESDAADKVKKLPA